ncbi:acetylcholine-gated cation-selective channel [Aureococcus anophagefferens]|nr:acetylcholine-gated cation-selective channel [Aureococcus anophagefferens]
MLHNENLNIQEAELPEAPPAPAVEPPAPTPAEAPPAEAQAPAQTPAAPPPAATPSAPPPADEGAAVAPGVVLRESALSFGALEDLDEHELARAYLRLDEHLADLKKGQKRRRELTTLKSDLRTRAKKKRGKRRVADESDSDGEDDDGTFRYTFATPDAPGSRPRDVAPAADATLEAALAALEASEIPVQDSRTNVTRPGAPAPRGLVLGAVNVRGHGGMRVSGATHERPRLAKLLCDVFRAHAPDPAFRFTTIQINCNYEAALHVDKFNLGPSYIVGAGDYGPPEDPKLPAEFAGRLWVQGRGALDVREQFVLFDGNAPHSTIPFAGARYTLIFFTHASQYALPEGERAYCDALGFPMPHPKLCKPPHMRTAEERLMAGRDSVRGLRRHYGRAVRAAESREGAAAAATFVTGDREGEAADEARCRADVVADDLVAEALAHRKPFAGRVERWEARANRRDEAGGARLLANDSVGQEAFKRTELARAAIAAGAPLVDHRVIVGLEWCKFARRWTAVTELRDKHLDPANFPKPSPPFSENTIEKYPLDKALVDYILKSPHNPDIKPPKKPPHKPAAQKPAPGPAAEARRAAPPPRAPARTRRRRPRPRRPRRRPRPTPSATS